MLNFTISEFVKSDTAKRYKIDNTPPLNVIDNILKLIYFCMQPLRNKANKPFIITSGYRCPQLNKLINGSVNSHHLQGFAADFHIVGMTIQQAFDFVRKSGIKYTQLIHEGNWLHISYIPDNLKCENLLYKNGKYSKI